MIAFDGMKDLCQQTRTLDWQTFKRENLGNKRGCKNSIVYPTRCAYNLFDRLWVIEVAMRTHVILPDKLIAEIDSLVGKRKRSRFVEEAIREKLKRKSLLKALTETAGVLPAGEYPQWETTEKTAAWVRESRQRDSGRLEKS
jgi:hypothetical protein